MEFRFWLENQAFVMEDCKKKKKKRQSRIYHENLPSTKN